MKQKNWSKEAPYCIYKHTSPSGKVYIGKCCYKNPANRWRKDGIGYNDSPLFWKAIQKYGWDNFKHEIIHEGLTKPQAAEIEIVEIAKYKSLNISYNLASGGEGGCGKMSPETRKKIGDANRGRKASKETIQKLKESHQNMTHLTNGKINVVVFSEEEKNKYIEQGYWVGRVLTIKENRKNRIWITKDKQNIFLTDSTLHLLDDYLSQGWHRGYYQVSHQTEEERQISNKKKGHPHTEEMKRQKSETIKQYGFKWMNNGVINKRIPQVEREKYLNDGWKIGRITKHDKLGRYIKV